LYVAAGLVPTPYICRVASGQIQVVAGDLIDSGFNGDGLSATQTLLNVPLSIVFTPGNGLVFTDVNNNRVRAIANLAVNSNSPPTAVIVAKPDHLGTAPFLVQLDGSQSTDPDGDIVSYQWDFGDNTTGNGPQVEHTYTVSGSFVVTLTVTDSAGNASTAQLTVFSAMPLINSSSSGRGAFSVGFGKSAGKDTFSISMKGVNGLTNQPGKPFTLFIGSFSITGTVAGGPRVKPGPAGKASATVAINAGKKTISASVKNASLAAAFTALGVNNQNTIGSPTVLVPVVISVNNGTLVVGDKLLFSYKTKFNGKAMGKFSQ
jgi:PKD repeat protein